MSAIPEQELRDLVREAIARRVQEKAPPPMAPFSSHPSHGRLPLLSGGDADGACLIEPAVRCSHCGYCQSYGH